MRALLTFIFFYLFFGNNSILLPASKKVTGKAAGYRKCFWGNLTPPSTAAKRKCSLRNFLFVRSDVAVLRQLTRRRRMGT
jgi:hypothetical protein